MNDGDSVICYKTKRKNSLRSSFFFGSVTLVILDKIKFHRFFNIFETQNCAVSFDSLYSILNLVVGRKILWYFKLKILQGL
jgi:hypothetical protein